MRSCCRWQREDQTPARLGVLLVPHESGDL